ncbi:hypothetical protein VTL71DRAFT_2108 [Oculimacula yallundae]|uniref:Uncharacterized protein n=1 Tax=Oculimacula yallundae TaxID=86028 RepID=A0ABR4C7Y2_9HELO
MYSISAALGHYKAMVYLLSCPFLLHQQTRLRVRYAIKSHMSGKKNKASIHHTDANPRTKECHPETPVPPASPAQPIPAWRNDIDIPTLFQKKHVHVQIVPYPPPKHKSLHRSDACRIEEVEVEVKRLNVIRRGRRKGGVSVE